MRLAHPRAAMHSPTDRPVILIAEDGDGTRQLSCLVLESYGFVCRSAGTVEAAIALLHHDPRIDAVFSDIHFPGSSSGIELALRALQAPFGIPVLLTSGLAPEYVEEILPEGVAFLAKPYTPKQLLRAIRRLIRPRRHSASAA
ncbi:MAG: response regulator [Pseudomonas sp.]